MAVTRNYTDVHVHHRPREQKVEPKKLLAVMDKARIDKIAIMSWYGENIEDEKKNIDEVARIIAAAPDRLYGLAWIEPKHKTPLVYLEEVIAEKGFTGFKMIPNTWYPSDEDLFPYYEKMASLDAPCLFHSGILYFPTYSSKYCRPVYYEDLIKVNNFRFALAHVSWPWTDECLALFGQWRSAKSEERITSKMFIDLTPGTPPEYRRDVLRKLLAFGAEDALLFGTDLTIPSVFDESLVKTWRFQLTEDLNIYRKLSISENTMSKILTGNFERFLGLAK